MLVFFCILALRLQHINWNVVISENKFACHLIGIINQTELSKHIRRKTNLWIQKKERKQNLTRATICLNQQINMHAAMHVHNGDLYMKILITFTHLSESILTIY